MKLISMLLVIFFLSIGTMAQNLVGNGGDVIASEFNFIARTAIFLLKKKTLSKVDSDLVLEIEKKIDSTLVESVGLQLTLDGRDVDAINYPSIQKISISRPRWEQIRLRTPSERARIVLHEYIWIAGTDDSSYQVSNRLIKEVSQELDQNSLSVESYQVLLSRYVVELQLYRTELEVMQQSGQMNFASFCFAMGVLMTQTEEIASQTRENSFMFSTQLRPMVETGVQSMTMWIENNVINCMSKTQIDIQMEFSTINEISKFVKYLMMMTQFPESETQ